MNCDGDQISRGAHAPSRVVEDALVHDGTRRENERHTIFREGAENLHARARVLREQCLASSAGSAALTVSLVHGQSAATTAWARSPLKLLTPRSRGETVWAYTSSFGGGMVAGDCTRLEVTVDARARCFLSTQASTKVYRNPAQLPCSHELVARVRENALLIVAPDPVQCFAESRYEQRQQFQLSASANLVLVDWMSGGRTARGERWLFQRYFTRNVIERDTFGVHPSGCPADENTLKRGHQTGRLLVDALLLDAADGPLASKFRGGRFNCFATVAILGPRLQTFAKEILEWAAEQPLIPRADFVFAASPLREGVLFRCAGVAVEQVGRVIHERLGFVRELLQDNPWARKW